MKSLIVYERSWFKGQDTVTLCLYMEARLQERLPGIEETWKDYVSDMVGALKSASAFMHTLHHSGLWLLDAERDALICDGLASVNFFQRLADTAFSLGYTRWKYQPKYHFFAEVLYSLQEARELDVPAMNPLSWATQLDEDFVGKISTASRQVSSRTIHTRTVQKYLLLLRAHWDS